MGILTAQVFEHKITSYEADGVTPIVTAFGPAAGVSSTTEIESNYNLAADPMTIEIKETGETLSYEQYRWTLKILEDGAEIAASANTPNPFGSPRLPADELPATLATEAYVDTKTGANTALIAANSLAITALEGQAYHYVVMNKKGKLRDNNYLEVGEVETKSGRGIAFPTDREVIEITLSVKDHKEESGTLKFYSDGSSTANISVAEAVVQTVTVGSPFTIPADKQMGVKWSGSETEEAILVIKMREV